jgi:hypothetical protein
MHPWSLTGERQAT